MSQQKPATPASPVSFLTPIWLFKNQLLPTSFWYMLMWSGVVPAAGEPTVTSNGSPAKTAFFSQSRPRSCTSHLPSSTSEPVQTQQPCSLKGSLSSDNIYAGQHGDGTGTQHPAGQGATHSSAPSISLLILMFVPALLTLASPFLDYALLQDGLIILNHQRERPINPVASHALDFSVGLCLCLSVCISSSRLPSLFVFLFYS